VPVEAGPHEVEEDGFDGGVAGHLEEGLIGSWELVKFYAWGV